MTDYTVLVVEDSPTARRTTIDILEAAGYQVVSASDGEEALEKAEQHSPDAVVLDIVLPKKNGYQVCRHLKQDQASLPVLMVTAKDQEKDRIWGHRQGADAYLSKPVQQDELIRSIKSLLSESAGEATHEKSCS
jgi:twitching motility two-component system response regulator PilH